MSAGTAHVLGLIRLRTDAVPTTGYFLLGERCLRNCAFCAQAQSSQARPDRLSRVVWPSFSLEQVLAALKTAQARPDFPLRRICLQVVNTREWRVQALEVLKGLGEATRLPVSVSCEVREAAELEELFAAGAVRIGLPLDVATPRLFPELKGGNWDHARGLLSGAARRWPGRISTHLIAGLGETEEEMARAMAGLLAEGITVGLFAFTPLRGTTLQDRLAPEPGSYRRMQAVRYLLTTGTATLGDLTFDDVGRLVQIRKAQEAAASLLGEGAAFRTSGCPDCNRPYYNEHPGGVMYNYPRPLTPQEVQAVLDEMNVVWKAAE